MAQSYIVSVSLAKGCYRHIQISENSRLDQLSQAILDAFELLDDHAYAFFMDNRFWSQVDAYYSPTLKETDTQLRFTDRVQLRQLALTVGDKFKYLFDFGDEFRFQCRILRMLQEDTPVALVIRSVGDSPEQYPDYLEDSEDTEDIEPLEKYFPKHFTPKKLAQMRAALNLPPETVELIHQYFLSASELYGIISVRKLMRIYNSQNPPVSEEDFLAVTEIFRHSDDFFAVLGAEAFYTEEPVSQPLEREIVAQHLYITGPEDYYKLAEGQQDKPFYIPPKEEFLQYFEGSYYHATSCQQKMLTFLRRQCHNSYASAEDVLLEIQDLLNMDSDFDYILYDMERLKVRFNSPGVLQTFFDLLTDLNNNTRKLINRGYTPNQIRQMNHPEKPSQQNLRVFSQLETPSQLQPSPVFQPISQTAKKPGRNDPCPCGSGLKYKKCCGK